eukprot:15460945-Alexandrium_andersonii.AAC.1
MASSGGLPSLHHTPSTGASGQVVPVPDREPLSLAREALNRNSEWRIRRRRNLQEVTVSSCEQRMVALHELCLQHCAAASQEDPPLICQGTQSLRSV